MAQVFVFTQKDSMLNPQVHYTPWNKLHINTNEAYQFCIQALNKKKGYNHMETRYLIRLDR